MTSLTAKQIITGKLLKNRIDQLNTPGKKREYLLNCLIGHGKIKEDDKNATENTGIKKDICEQCGSEDIRYTSSERICQNCGAITKSTLRTEYRYTYS